MSPLPGSEEVPRQALGSLTSSRKRGPRACARWDEVDFLGGDPSSGVVQCSRGCLEHLEALHKGLSAELPAAGKDPECLGCSALVILHLSPLCATLGSPLTSPEHSSL